MFDLDQDMKLAFLEEAQSLLDGTEAAFMALDAGDRSPELVDRIFRLAHNFKGSAKTVGLEHLSHFGHVFEDVLTLIKSGALVPNAAVCTTLLQTLDHFKAYVAGLKTDLAYVHDTAGIIEALTALAQPIASAAPPVPAETTVPAGAAASISPAPSASAPLPTPPLAPAPASPLAPAPASSAAPAEEENLKINRRKLDTLLNLIGEIVVNQSMIAGHRTNGTLPSEPSLQILGYMEKLVHELQDVSMSLRMTPVAPLFQRLRRIARDAGQSMGKTIQFSTDGDHVELDKVVLDRISDPLTHLVRNAVDHGVESDAERAELGKRGPASVTLTAQPQEDRVLITIADNGRGMRAEKLIAKALEKGLISASEQLTDEQAHALIFRPGFSTKEQVTDMSGRGVGMDVVQRAVDELKGTIQIRTRPGEGTQFLVSLPLSMSILTGMVIGVDGQKYVVPTAHLVETIEYRHLQIETSTGKGRMINLRGEVIPVYSLSSILHPGLRAQPALRDGPGHYPGLVTTHHGRKVSFEIDRIHGQQQIVLKKLGSELNLLPGIVAGAILATGEPGLVLNLNDFIEKGLGHAA